MKIGNVEVLVTNTEIKKGKKDNNYLVINFVDINDGQLFTIIERENIELIKQLKNMTKYILDLSVNNNKYGVQLNINEIVKEIGGI